jgi:hypothetical protein
MTTRQKDHIMITKADAEFLLFRKQDAMTENEQRELAQWWLRDLRRQLKRLEPIAATVADLRAQGKQDANESCRRVVAWVQGEREHLISTAAVLAGADRYAEFRDDFETIAARAEAL